MATRTKTARPATSPIIETMNDRLADLIDLHWQVKQAHWNVVGANFIAVHELFDEQANTVRMMADTIAERIRGLQAAAEGTARIAVERSTLEEFPHGLIDWQDAIGELVERYEQQSGQWQQAAEEAGDAGDLATQDVYVEMIRQIDEAAYFLRAHLGERGQR